MSRKALVVDDSKTIRMMVTRLLKDAGFEVAEGANGSQGLDELAKGPVDIVITDLNMPVMDGLAFIREMRGRADTKLTPILLLTTDSEASQKDEARVAGATGWVVKPFQPDQLLSVINKLVC